MFSSPGIFNVLDPWLGGLGMVAGAPATNAANNTAVLQAIINLAQNPAGGACAPTGTPYAATILFPGNSQLPAAMHNKGQVVLSANPCRSDICG
jgi:hypothetical protein